MSILFSCNSQKNIKPDKYFKTTQSKCPENGVCSFEILKGKAFTIKSKFGNAYPEFHEASNTMVLKFEYVRNLMPNTQDSGYRELIYIEVDSDVELLELENMNLKRAKVSYGRLCFCRGQTGYYTVNKGNLQLKKLEDSLYQLHLELKVSEVPQVIKSINETFKL